MEHNPDTGTGALQQLTQGAHVRQIPAGQIILYQGDTPLEVCILKDGVVKLYDIDEQGNEKILHIVQPPTLVPFAFFSGMHDPLKWFYATLSDCEVYVLSANELKLTMRADPDLTETLATHFSSDVHELLTRLSSLSKTNARDKVLAALKFLEARHATARRNGWRLVNFPVSHQLIADLCGITRESAAVAMKELQNEKIIRYQRTTILEIQSSGFEE